MFRLHDILCTYLWPWVGLLLMASLQLSPRVAFWAHSLSLYCYAEYNWRITEDGECKTEFRTRLKNCWKRHFWVHDNLQTLPNIGWISPAAAWCKNMDAHIRPMSLIGLLWNVIWAVWLFAEIDGTAYCSAKCKILLRSYANLPTCTICVIPLALRPAACGGENDATYHMSPRRAVRCSAATNPVWTRLKDL